MACGAGLLIVVKVVTVVITASGVACGCPFCGVVGESLAERRDRAMCVAIGEPAGPAMRDAAGLPVQPFTVIQMIREPRPLPGREAADLVPPANAVTARVPAPVTGLALLFATAGDAQAWAAISADEPLIAHVVAAPATTEPAARRLAWFLPRLEHPDPVIAADAFTEFGLAPFAAVRAVAGGFDVDALQAWLRDPGIVQQRRGFYGLALGLAAAGREADDPAAVAARAALAAEIAAPVDDFRAGFDGILGGLLVADGAPGLEALEQLGLLDAAARPVDQRHALTALRFARENLADTIPLPRVAAATARLLAAPAVAADAAVDLARYEWWDAVADVAALWSTLGGDDPLVRRAVAGYLAACPKPEAAAALAAIRARDPDRLTAALEAAAFPAAR